MILVLPGRTAAFRVAEVRPQVSGIVKQRLFTEGALVGAGQPLFQLDDATYRADHGMAKAALARAEAGLEAARLRANRSANLVKTGLVSAQDNDNAVAALREAAYRALGYPDGSIDKAAARALHRIEIGPVRDGEVAVVEGPGATWAYADPMVEGLGDVEKQMLRMGPRNARILQAKAREISQALGMGAPGK